LIGVGPALRKARQLRGITVEEVSRDTKLTVEQLRALEDEHFDDALGDAYVRGALRTYARYLGLDDDKVARAYAANTDQPDPPPPPAKMGRVEKAIAASRIRDNQRFLQLAALSLLLVAIVFGLLSRTHGTPPPASLPTTPGPVAPTQDLQAVIVASKPVTATITVDGITQVWHMRAKESRTATATTTLVIRLDDGSAARVTVNGRPLGRPDPTGAPWVQSFDAATTAWYTPAPSPKASGSALPSGVAIPSVGASP